MSLPIDARAARRAAQARAGGAGAGQGGGGGVRGRRGRHRDRPRPPRRAGDRRRGRAPRRAGVVLAAEEPSKIRGGALLGGRGGPMDNFVGEATKYVISKAPLPGHPHRAARLATSPTPVDARLRADRAAATRRRRRRGTRRRRRRATRAAGERRRRCSVESAPMSSSSSSAPAASGPRSPARCWPPATTSRSWTRTRCRTSASTPAWTRTWEDAGGRFTVGHGMEIDALREAGIEEADVFIASTDGDNTNLTIAQIAPSSSRCPKVIVRVMDPAARRVVPRAGAAHDLSHAATRSRCSSARSARSRRRCTSSSPGPARSAGTSPAS